MNKKILSLSVVCLMLFGACKKNKTEPKSDQCQLRKIIAVTLPGKKEFQTLYTYDEKGRVIKKYTLDPEGRIIKVNTGRYHIEVQFSYDQHGYMIRRDFQQFGAITGSAYYTYKDGNLILITRDSKNSQEVFKMEITYTNYIVKNSLFSLPLDQDDVSPELWSYLGKGSKNLISDIRPDTGTITSYNYKIDQNNKVTNQTERTKLLDGSYVQNEINYTYDCK